MPPVSCGVIATEPYALAGYDEFDWHPATEMEGYQLAQPYLTEPLSLQTRCIAISEAKRLCDENELCDAFSYSSVGATLYKAPIEQLALALPDNVTWAQGVTWAKTRAPPFIFVQQNGLKPRSVKPWRSVTGSVADCEDACSDEVCMGFSRSAGALDAHQANCALFGAVDTMLQDEATRWFSKQTPSLLRAVSSQDYLAADSSGRLGWEARQEASTLAVVVSGDGFVRVLFSDSGSYLAVDSEGHVYTEPQEQSTAQSKLIRSIQAGGTMFTSLSTSYFLALSAEAALATSKTSTEACLFDTALLPPPDATQPELVATSPTEDEEAVSAKLQYIALTFDQKIARGDLAQGWIEIIPESRLLDPITISVRSETRVRIKDRTMMIVVRTLDQTGSRYTRLGSVTKYTVRVPEGAVRDVKELQNPSASLEFAFTSEDSQAPILIDTSPYVNQVASSVW